MKQKVYPATNKFSAEVYSRLSSEGKRKVDLLFNEYGLENRELTPEEVDEAVKMLTRIVEAHTVKTSPRGSWVSAAVVVAVLSILVALLIAFSKAKGTE